eukprot:3072781-Ditylum_brightwellii.AAC.1
MVHGILSTNKQLFRYKQCGTDRCPLCHTEAETRNHLIECKSMMATQWREDMLQKLPKSLLQPHTKTAVTRSLLIDVWKTLGMSLNDKKEMTKYCRGKTNSQWRHSLMDCFIKNGQEGKICIYGGKFVDTKAQQYTVDSANY